jgi:hypothetical protein
MCHASIRKTRHFRAIATRRPYEIRSMLSTRRYNKGREVGLRATFGAVAATSFSFFATLLPSMSQDGPAAREVAWS